MVLYKVSLFHSDWKKNMVAIGDYCFWLDEIMSQNELLQKHLGIQPYLWLNGQSALHMCGRLWVRDRSVQTKEYAHIIKE